jgi:PAS domain S-box-containing protein
MTVAGEMEGKMEKVGKSREELVLEIRRLQLELAKAEDKFQALAEQSPNMIFINQRGRIIYANRQCETVMGYSRAEFYADQFDFLTLIATESRDLVVKNFYKHMRGICSPSYECAVVTKLQQKIETIISTELITYEGDISILGIVTDITTLKRTERELRETQRTLLTLMSNLPGMVYRCHNDQDWTLEFVSHGCKALTGYDAEALINARSVSYGQLIHPADRAKVWGDVQKAVTQGVPFELTYRIYDAQNHMKWVWEQGQGVFSPQGELVALEGYIADISERKKSEEEKEKIQAQLLQAQKMDAVGLLAGGVAHDFNNLLTAIIGYSDLLLDGLSENHELRPDIAEIKKIGQQAAALTRQLLAFSRKQQHQPRILDLNELLSNMQSLLRRLISEDIELTTVFETEPATVNADSSQIEQVVMNLIVNARDAMPGGGKIWLATRSLTLTTEDVKPMLLGRPGIFVCLSVTDTGTGMSKEVMQHLFEPFFTTKEKDRGTGLGLSVVYGIVEQHNGWIHVDSEPGHGAEFKIYLPHVAERPEQKKKDTAAFQASRGNGEHILLVEDEEKLRLFASKMLSKHGYNVYATANAQEAFAAFACEQNHFEVLFSDVVLPDQNGLQLATSLLAKQRDLRILLASGYSEQPSFIETFQQQGFHFLAKPYTVGELLLKLKQLLAKPNKS